MSFFQQSKDPVRPTTMHFFASRKQACSLGDNIGLKFDTHHSDDDIMDLPRDTARNAVSCLQASSSSQARSILSSPSSISHHPVDASERLHLRRGDLEEQERRSPSSSHTYLSNHALSPIVSVPSHSLNLRPLVDSNSVNLVTGELLRAQHEPCEPIATRRVLAPGAEVQHDNHKARGIVSQKEQHACITMPREELPPSTTLQQDLWRVIKTLTPDEAARLMDLPSSMRNRALSKLMETQATVKTLPNRERHDGSIVTKRRLSLQCSLSPPQSRSDEECHSMRKRARFEKMEHTMTALSRWNKQTALFRSSKRILPATYQPGPNTVLLGPKKRFRTSPGNVQLQGICQRFIALYHAPTTSREQKSEIVSHILCQVYRSCPVGAFVRYKNGRYYEVEDLLARDKIASQLRNVNANQKFNLIQQDSIKPEATNSLQHCDSDTSCSSSSVSC